VQVTEGVITYAGTLQINGTKEKIRLGGVPVIKPGFEYNVNIVDEREEGMSIFRGRYPEFTGEVIFRLMKVN